MTILDHISLRPFLPVALAVVVGVMAGDALAPTLQSDVLWMALPAALLGVVFALYRCPVAQGIMLLVLSASIAAASAAISRHGRTLPLPIEDATFSAVVVSPPERHGKVFRCTLLAVDGPLSGRRIQASFLRTDDDSGLLALHTGYGVRCTATLTAVEELHPDEHFSHVRYCEARGIAATTLILPQRWSHASVSLRRLSTFERCRYGAMMLRERLLQRFREAGGDDYAVVAAMTLGSKSAISPALRATYSDAGASHLLALSGLHVGVIGAMLTLLFVGRRRIALGATLSVVAIWCYAVLVGLSPSVVRAATIFTLYSLAALLRRERISINALAFAATVTLVVSPASLWDVSFQMSYLAVLAILLFLRPLYAVIGAEALSHPVVKWTWGIVVVSLSAQIGVAPVVLYYFGSFPCLFLLTNIIAIPLATAIIYLAAMFFLCTPIAPLQHCVESLMIAAARLLNTLLQAIAALPFASIGGIHFSLLQVVLCYMLFACIYFLAMYGRRLARSAQWRKRKV